MLDDDDENANLPAEGAIPVAGEGWPASAAGAEPSSPAFIPYHPSMNAQQRRMIDMMNTRKMQEYRQELQERRSAATREAVSDRQQRSFEFRERNANARRAYSEQQADRRQQERLNTEQRKSQYEADRRDATEAMKIRAEDRAAARREAHERRVEHEKRLQNDPDYRREFEFAGVDQAEAAGRDASRRRALDALPDQTPRTMALPIGMGNGPGASFNAPSTAMQMPEGAGRAVGDSQKALDLRLDREFGGAEKPEEALLSRTRAQARIDKDYETLSGYADDAKLEATTRSRPRRDAFKKDADERTDTYGAELDKIINSGKPEKLSELVDTSALPKVDPQRKNRMIGLMDKLAAFNDLRSNELAEAVYAVALSPRTRLGLVTTPNGRFLEIGERGDSSRLAVDQDTYRQLMELRGVRQREFEKAEKAAADRQKEAEAKKRTARSEKMQAIDDADLFERDAMRSPRDEVIYRGAQTMQGRAKFEDAMRRMRERAGAED